MIFLKAVSLCTDSINVSFWSLRVTFLATQTWKGSLHRTSHQERISATIRFQNIEGGSRRSFPLCCHGNKPEGESLPQLPNHQQAAARCTQIASSQHDALGFKAAWPMIVIQRRFAYFCHTVIVHFLKAAASRRLNRFNPILRSEFKAEIHF